MLRIKEILSLACRLAEEAIGDFMLSDAKMIEPGPLVADWEASTGLNMDSVEMRMFEAHYRKVVNWWRWKSRAIEYIAGEIPALLSSWRRTQNLTGEDQDLAADDAADLLASWAGMQRLAESDRPTETWTELDEAIDKDGPLMAELAIKTLRPEDWLRKLKDLDEATENALSEEAATVVQSASLALFRELDAAQLVEWTASRILGKEKTQKLRAKLEDCEGEFQVLTDLFHTSAADFADVVRSAFRKDMMGFDFDLHMIASKYHVIVQEAEDSAGFGEGDYPPIDVGELKRR